MSGLQNDQPNLEWQLRISHAHKAEAGDQEMAEAEPVTQEPSGGDVPRAADIEMGPDGLESMDESFLEALPADLRLEMTQAQANQARRSTAAAQPSSQPDSGEGDQARAMSQDPRPAEGAPSDTPAVPPGRRLSDGNMLAPTIVVIVEERHF